MPFADVEEAYRYPAAGGPAELDPVLSGGCVDLVPLSAIAHAEELFEAFSAHAAGATKTGAAIWDYLPTDGFADKEALKGWIEGIRTNKTYFFLAIKTGSPRRARGCFSLMRAEPEDGCIEVGWVALSPLLQRTRAATEAFYLLFRYVFDELGYRRLEWKCDALNMASRRAAARLGFSWEGMFRNALVRKGRNRDTAWFGMTSEDWSKLDSEAFQPFLAPGNFDVEGLQRESLSALTAPLLHATDPLQDHERAESEAQREPAS